MPGLRASLDGTLPVGARVLLGASVTHVGAQHCVNPDTDADIRLAPQAIGGLTLQRSWDLGGGAFRLLRLIAGMDNVTDAAMYEQCGLPRAGRTLRIGVDLL
jgi:hypothetical protein